MNELVDEQLHAADFRPARELRHRRVVHVFTVYV